MSLPPGFPKVSERQSAKILMVCLGNICRSPTAEAVLRKYAENRSLNLDIDSAGTASYHVGEHPHPPSIKYGKQRGYDLSPLIARQFSVKDFTHFDLILAADRSNYHNIMSMCPRGVDCGNKVKMITDFLPEQSKFTGATSVPDPWGGDKQDFYQVIDMCEETMDVLCNSIQKHSESD